ncbi:MAG TPA: NusA-like transcription termination signal-binding factor [Nitrososphaeraceae archaeon]|nr:NusA-like transcription termination signal-binding factor [Nitrososphaeraceae archaeon]
MTEKIKLTSDELGLISLFQSITSAVARDCVVDEKMDRVIFIVNKGQMGLAIGKGGATIRQLQNVVGKKVELVEYSDDPSEFIRNILNTEMINEIKINDKIDGTRQAIVIVDAKKKGVVVGREGRNAEKARLLAKRYFQISNVLIMSEDRSAMHNDQVNM